MSADQAVPLGHGDEELGAHDPLDGVVPAQQCLGRGDLQAARIDLGLVDELELVVLDGALQLAREFELLAHALGHVQVVLGPRAPTGELDAAHGGGRMPHEQRTRAVLRVARHPHRSRELDLLPAQGNRLGQNLQHAPRRPARGLDVALHQHDELVAGHARTGFLRGELPQPPAGGRQDGIAPGMALQFVDPAHAVQPDVEQRKAQARGLRFLVRVVEHVLEGGAWLQAGQGVARGLLGCGNRLLALEQGVGGAGRARAAPGPPGPGTHPGGGHDGTAGGEPGPGFRACCHVLGSRPRPSGHATTTWYPPAARAQATSVTEYGSIPAPGPQERGS